MRMALAMVGVFLPSCRSPAPSSPATPPQTGTAIATRPTAASSAPSAMAQLATAESRYGRILVDGSGRTVYLFDIERDPTPRCYDACAVSWPPLLATTASTTDPPLHQTSIAVSPRTNDSQQLTYSAHPLYYYVTHRNVADTKWHDANEFGV